MFSPAVLIPSCCLSFNATLQSCCWNSSWLWKYVFKPYFFLSVYHNRRLHIKSTNTDPLLAELRSCKTSDQLLQVSKYVSAVCNVCWALSPLVLCHTQSLSLFCDSNDYLDLIIHIMIESFWDTKSIFLDIKLFGRDTRSF